MQFARFDKFLVGLSCFLFLLFLITKNIIPLFVIPICTEWFALRYLIQIIRNEYKKQK